MPFILLDLSQHDIIIRRKFFKHFYINIDVAYRRLLWPKKLKPYFSARQPLPFNKDVLRLKGSAPRH